MHVRYYSRTDSSSIPYQNSWHNDSTKTTSFEVDFSAALTNYSPKQPQTMSNFRVPDFQSEEVE